jgi:hypothetical protein
MDESYITKAALLKRPGWSACLVARMLGEQVNTLPSATPKARPRQRRSSRPGEAKASPGEMVTGLQLVAVTMNLRRYVFTQPRISVQ